MATYDHDREPTVGSNVRIFGSKRIMKVESVTIRNQTKDGEERQVKGCNTVWFDQKGRLLRDWLPIQVLTIVEEDE